MNSPKLERVSYWANISASLVAILAFGFGYIQFQATQRAQRESLEFERESQAVQLFAKYNELMMEWKANADSIDDETRFWRDNLAITITESIFKLREQDYGWSETVKFMLDNHMEMLKTDGLNCKTYDAAFVKFVNKHARKNVCHQVD